MFYNRDLSWLGFNDRVLQEAADSSVPVMERIKFLSIFSSNLDEFFRVRFPAMVALSSLSGKIRKKTIPPTDKHLASFAKEIINKQLLDFGSILREQILPELEKNDIILYYDQPILEEHKPEIRDIFLSSILSFIQPIFIAEDFAKHFTPENDKLYFLVSLKQKNTDHLKHCIVNIPADNLPRFFQLSPIGEKKYIIFIDDIIRENTDCIFPGFDVITTCGFKVTRDAELLLDESLGKDIVKEIEKKLEKREMGKLSRFLFQRDMPQSLQLYLKAVFTIKEEELFEGGRYHNLKDLAKLPIEEKKFFYPQIKPLQPFQTHQCGEIFDLIKSKDILLHFPYHSYNPVLSFFNQAAIDPDVRSIHITLYRVAADSHIVNALISAAKNGKEVVAFIELKARFDEANNIKWSKEMKKAGIKLIYSLPNIKVHSKIALIEKKGYSYAFIGTGNFNENTARYYADHTLLTADAAINKDLRELFAALEHKNEKARVKDLAPAQLLISQVNMLPELEKMIKEQMILAKKKLPAFIKLKLNSLEDYDMIQLLYKAGKAGVSIQLIIRGICCINAGKAGFSENIEVRRIVDRYLEHSRIFIFGQGKDIKVFIGSADWMTRNLHYRIEVCTPINDKTVQQELESYFELQWNDDAKAVVIKENNEQQYLARSETSKKIRSQQTIYEFLKEKQS
jgi:polyphosphate kinase